MNKIVEKKQKLAEKMKAFEEKKKQEELKMKEQLKQFEDELNSEIVKIVRDGIKNNVEAYALLNDLKILLT